MVATLFVNAALFLQSQATSWDLRSMWSSMSTLPRIVVAILFILSIYSFGVMIDRALMYSAARKQSRVFVQQVAGAEAVERAGAIARARPPFPLDPSVKGAEPGVPEHAGRDRGQGQQQDLARRADRFAKHH